MTDVNSQYYNTHATEYFLSTRDVDMQPVYDKFLSKVITHGHILDAGCGSGRDTKAFKDLGFKVSAIDASKELVKLARLNTGVTVEHKTLQQISDIDKYNGIWCCASLLHVPFEELPKVMNNLSNALTRNGVLYVSFKDGEPSVTPREHNGRLFTDLNEQALTLLIEQDRTLSIVKLWTSGDQCAGREDEKWLNAIITKVETVNSKSRATK